MKRSNKAIKPKKYQAFILIIATAVVSTYILSLFNLHALIKQQQVFTDFAIQQAENIAAEEPTRLETPLQHRNRLYRDAFMLLLNASTTANGRKILTRYDIRMTFDESDGLPLEALTDRDHWNSQTEFTEWIPYKNEKYEIEMEIPYNPNWGSPQVGISPFDERIYDKERSTEYLHLEFGPLSYYICGEGCGWPHLFDLISRPVRNEAEIIAEAEKRHDYIESRDYPMPTITKLKLGESTAIKITEQSAFGTYTFYEVLGNKHNFYIGTHAFLEADFPDFDDSLLLEIIKRIKIE